MEDSARLRQQRVVARQARACADPYRGQSPRADVETVNKGTDRHQRRVTVQTKARRQHLEGHTRADVRDGGAITVRSANSGTGRGYRPPFPPSGSPRGTVSSACLTCPGTTRRPKARATSSAKRAALSA